MKIMDKISGFLASAAIALQLGTDAAKAADPEMRPASGTAEAAAGKLGLGSTREIWVGDNVGGLIPPNVRTPIAEKTMSPFDSRVSVSAVAEDRAMAKGGELLSCQIEQVKQNRVEFRDGADFTRNVESGMTPLQAFKASKPFVGEPQYRAPHIDAIHTNDAALPPIVRVQAGAPVKSDHAYIQIGEKIIPAAVEPQAYTTIVKAPKDVDAISSALLKGGAEVHFIAVSRLNNLAMLSTYEGSEDITPVFEKCRTGLGNGFQNIALRPEPVTDISFTVADVTGPREEVQKMAAATAGSFCLKPTEAELARAVPVHISRSTGVGDIPGATGLRIGDKIMVADYVEAGVDKAGNGYTISVSQSIAPAFGRTTYNEPADSCADNNVTYRVIDTSVPHNGGGKAPIYHTPRKETPREDRPDKPWFPFFPGDGGKCDKKECEPEKPVVCVPGKEGKGFLRRLGL